MAQKLIKVCGMREAQNIRALTKLAIDFMGFILYPKSPRYVFNAQGAIRTKLPQNIKKTAVAVNLSTALIIDVVKEFEFDAVQIHGSESVAYCNQIRKILPQIIILKAVGIDAQFDFEELKNFENVVDYFLFDTKSDAHGGAGKKFNWQVLNQYTLQKPFFLSGGIGLDDVSILKDFNHPQCIGYDINSRFESAPAFKDIASIEKFLELIKN